MRAWWGRFAGMVLLGGALVACGGGGDGGGDPTGPGERSVSKVAGDGGQSTAGLAVTTRPSVRVVNAKGQGVAGLAVTFAVASGNGSITGADQVTDADGRATVGSWTLGQSAGTNTLTATVAGLNPVTFSVTGRAGAATQFVKTAAADNQTAAAGTAVPVLPSVTVSDQFGNPVQGATVTFAVASGGGSITGANATTSASGVATVGSWTLGAFNGVNTLTATTAGFPAVTFTATGVDLCPATAYTIGSTATGSIAVNDCSYISHRYDFFQTTVAAQQGVTFTMSPTGFAPYIDLFDRTLAATTVFPGFLVATNGANTVGVPFTIRAIVKPGTFYIGLRAFTDGTTGAYSLTSAVVPEDAGGCEFVWVERGITTSQTIGDTDCSLTPLPGLRLDGFPMAFDPGQRVVVTMTPVGFTGELRVLNTQGNVVASATGSGVGATVSLTFTSGSQQPFILLAGRTGGSGTQNYTISFQP